MASPIALGAPRSARQPFPSNRDTILLIAFFSSGIVGLGLELIWVRTLGLAFGSETFGMLAVLAGFFAGLAIGSAALHRTVQDVRRPIRVYIVAECVVAVYASFGSSIMHRLADAVPRAIGPFVGDNGSLAALSLNLAIATIVLLPATICMGATSVAVIEAWRRRRSVAQNASTVAWVYASNTLGATLGILLATYVLLPALGIQSASRVLAGFGLAAAGLAWVWERAGLNTETPTPGLDADIPRQSSSPGPATTVSPRAFIGALLFLTGLAGIGLETVATQVLAQILDGTVHTFANILAVYLLGMAFGAWLLTRQGMREVAEDKGRLTSNLLFGLAATAVLAGAVLSHTAAIISALEPAGASYAWRLTVQTGVIAAIFLPVTVCMGASFSQLLRHFTGEGVGYAAAINTAGGTLAPFVFGLVLIRFAGYGVAFSAAVALYVVTALAADVARRDGIAWPMMRGVALVAAAALTYSSLVLVRFPANVEVLEQRVGMQGVVSVLEAATVPGVVRSRILIINQDFQMGASPGGVEKRMGHLPMLITRAPRRVLHLGVGTGISSGAALSYDVERLAVVDLVPEVLDGLNWFSQYNGGLHDNPRVTLHASDARRFVSATPDTYDAIVADLFHPSRDGTSSLYTQEHFLGIRSRLRPGGVFVQWLPIYQLHPRDLRTITRTFLDVFPDADSVLASYSVKAAFGLIGWAPGSTDGRGVDVRRAETRLREKRGPGEVFEGLPDVLATYMLDASGLRQYAGPGALNTDDNQRITFDAASGARISEGQDFYKALASLLPYRRAFRDEFVAPTDEPVAALRQRVEGYGRAATHYLAAEIAFRAAGGNSLPPAAIAEYVKSDEEDPRFTSARRRLLELAGEYPADARAIVARLCVVHPERSDLGELRARLDTAGGLDQMRATIVRFLQTGRQ